LFADGSAYYSPDNRNLGGGGSTVSAAPTANSLVKLLVRVGGGLLSQFADGLVYLSPDGKNLAGGGGTIRVPAWDTSIANGPFAARDSAQGAEFAGRLWLSGGFRGPKGQDSCFNTCSFFELWSSTTRRHVPGMRPQTSQRPPCRIRGTRHRLKTTAFKTPRCRRISTIHTVRSWFGTATCPQSVDGVELR